MKIQLENYSTNNLVVYIYYSILTDFIALIYLPTWLFTDTSGHAQLVIATSGSYGDRSIVKNVKQR